MEGRQPSVVLGVDPGPAVGDEKFRDLGLASEGGGLQRRPLLAVVVVDIGTVTQQLFYLQSVE